jgi:nicotinate-nucleotide pyrophosphorylase (carboxylating)
MKSVSLLDRVIRQALEEDRAWDDVTTQTLVDASARAEAVIFCKQDAIVCGLDVAKRVFHALNPGLHIQMLVKDGERIKKNQKILRLKGPTRALLTAERTALNFLSYLSAIATKTNRFVGAVKPFKTQILDTRKTTPTLRFLERYAVHCGGGYNHRDNLSDMMLIKDNHWLTTEAPLAQVIDQAVSKISVAVEVEVDRLDQLEKVLKSKADVILLDNMTPAMIRRAVILRKAAKSAVLLEVSGGINLKNVRRYAQTGVDRISIGELTHSREAVDFSMEVVL